MSPRAFASAAAFRKWLTQHHGRSSELLVRLAKTGAGKGLTYKQALDEALCFGWIDGVRRGIDEASFSVRFTPRKPKSYWSKVNLAHAERLEAAGRMHAAGRAALARGEKAPEGRYSFESRATELEQALLRRFKAEERAWADFQARPPWYRRVSSFWVMSAKKPETRAKRFALLLACSLEGITIPMLTRKPPK